MTYHKKEGIQKSSANTQINTVPSKDKQKSECQTRTSNIKYALPTFLKTAFTSDKSFQQMASQTPQSLLTDLFDGIQKKGKPESPSSDSLMAQGENRE